MCDLGRDPCSSQHPITRQPSATRGKLPNAELEVRKSALPRNIAVGLRQPSTLSTSFVFAQTTNPKDRSIITLAF